MTTKKDWVWMPHPGHFIVADKCQFHLATYLGNGYIVSTIGEYWPERGVREIHASIFDPDWHKENNHLLGDNYDATYRRHFGFEQLGMDRTYETMVFKAVENNGSSKCEACPWIIESGNDVDFAGYNSPREAYDGHMKLCDEWSKAKQMIE